MMRAEKDRLGNSIARLGNAEALTLANICSVAAARFKDNAAELRKLPVAWSLADQFDAQAAEAAAYAVIFADADHIEIVSETEVAV